MSVSRMFEMLYILLERDRVTAAELAKRLEVSVRTVYRDAQALCEAGVPLYAERGIRSCMLEGWKLFALHAADFLKAIGWQSLLAVSLGMAAVGKPTFGGSDNNVSVAYGIPGIVIANGMRDAHSTNEHVLPGDLAKVQAIVEKLLTIDMEE